MCESFRCSLSYAHKVSGNYNFGFGSNEGHVMPPDFFLQGLRVNAAAYIEVLEAVVKLCIDSVRGERPYIYQQDSAPSHKAMMTQDWMSENHLT